MPEINADKNPVAGLAPEFARAYQAAVQADRKPVENLEQRREKLQEKVNLLSDLVSKADGLRQILPGLGTPFAMRRQSKMVPFESIQRHFSFKFNISWPNR